MEPTSATSTSLNFPSVLVFAIISFFAIRYFFFSSPAAASSTSSSSSSLRRSVPADRVEQVAAMFPQLNRRDIEWDLMRNGSSVQATTERVLREGRLPAEQPMPFEDYFQTIRALKVDHLRDAQAPPNFRPSSPASNTTPTTANISSSNASTQHKPSHPDLITRYNLSTRISNEAAEEEQQVKGRQAWSQNKNEREASLRKRSEDMVLQARRRMEAKEMGAAVKGKKHGSA